MSIIARVLAILIFLFCNSARAYIPDTGYIFKELAKNNAKIKTLKIDQKRIVFGKQYENGRIEVAEEIYLQIPWKYARKSVYGGKTRLAVYDGFRYLMINDGKWVEPEKKPTIPFIFGFYMSRDKDELSSFLSKRGLDIYSTTLDRKDELVDILFSSTDKARVKLWLDKELFSPLSFFVKGDGANTADVENVYYDYRQHASGFYFPMKMKKFSGELLEQYEILQVYPDVKFSPSLFDLSYLKKRYPKLEKSEASDYTE